MRSCCLALVSLRLVLAGLAALGPGASARAQDVPGYPPLTPQTMLQGPYDPRELAMLPRYCYFTQIFRQFAPGGNDVQEQERWYAYLGPTYHHLHHYCWAMMKTNRALLLARDRRVRQFYLNDSIGEFDYVIERATPDFILLPEILTKRGENQFLLNRAPLGILDLERAIEIKPDYWPPYARLADYYKEAGETAKARRVLESGLKASPQAAALTRRLLELGPARDK